jgi:hypothetical protein
MDTSLWWLTTLAKNPSMLSEAPRYYHAGVPLPRITHRGRVPSGAGKGGSDGRLKNSHNRLVSLNRGYQRGHQRERLDRRAPRSQLRD